MSTDIETDGQNSTPSPTNERSAPAWTWLPTSNGALHRSRVIALVVERVDGAFKEGATSMWTLYVRTIDEAEAVPLRPHFVDAAELCAWVDRVFPGAAFTLLPPAVVAEAASYAPPEAGDDLRLAFGSKATDAIRVIGNGLAGGNSYEPDQGYRPPPGAAPRMI